MALPVRRAGAPSNLSWPQLSLFQCCLGRSTHSLIHALICRCVALKAAVLPAWALHGIREVSMAAGVWAGAEHGGQAGSERAPRPGTRRVGEQRAREQAMPCQIDMQLHSSQMEHGRAWTAAERASGSSQHWLRILRAHRGNTCVDTTKEAAVRTAHSSGRRNSSSGSNSGSTAVCTGAHALRSWRWEALGVMMAGTRGACKRGSGSIRSNPAGSRVQEAGAGRARVWRGGFDEVEPGQHDCLLASS